MARWRLVQKVNAALRNGDKKESKDRQRRQTAQRGCMHACVCMRRPLIKPLVRLLVSVCEPYLCLRVSHLCAGG